MKRKICVVTGTRAEYGLLKHIMKEINIHPSLELYTIVTGSHLSKKYGYTIKEIEKDNFKIDDKVDMKITGKDKKDMAKSIGYGIIGITESLIKIKPDILLILGDRGEALAAAIAASYLDIIIAHIHGGDESDGGIHIDDKIRHVITKLSHIHFPVTKKSAQRIEKLGEKKWRIKVVSAPGLDAILKRNKKPSNVIAKKFNLDLKKPILLVVQHPSLIGNNADKEMEETMKAIKELKMQTIIIYPNSDAGGIKMIDVINKYKYLSFLKIYKNLSQEDYFDIMQIANVMIGNSSSGTIESPLFNLPVVNIGNRESTRESAGNKIYVSHDKDKIKNAIKKSLINKIFIQENPYNNGSSSKKIVNFLSSIEIDDKIIKKVL